MGNNKLQNTDFNHVIGLIYTAQNKVFKTVNQELVLLYWEIGSFVSGKVNSGDWGDGVVIQLADYIKSYYPDLKEFTKRGLYRMKQFYETYYTIEKVSTLLTQLQRDVNQVFKDTYVFEFALRRNLSPALIADYETKLIDKKLLQQKLHDLYVLFDQKRMEL